jgi:hypothetical protein
MSAIKDWDAYNAAARVRGKELNGLHPELVKGFAALSAGAAITKNWTTWNVLGQPAGYIQTHESFTFATVKGAGHEAPGYVPISSFELLNAFVSGRMEELQQQPAAAAAAAAAPAKLSQGSILRAAAAKTRAAQRRAAGL